MQLQIFNIPVGNDAALEECNKFLRSHKIVTLREEFCSQTGSWNVLIRFVGSSAPVQKKENEKVDYKDVLSHDDFIRFARLREIRNTMAQEHSVPPYLIFTNEELAQMAVFEKLTISQIKSIKGIGEKRTEKYGELFISGISNDPID